MEYHARNWLLWLSSMPLLWIPTNVSCKQIATSSAVLVRALNTSVYVLAGHTVHFKWPFAASAYEMTNRKWLLACNLPQQQVMPFSLCTLIFALWPMVSDGITEPLVRCVMESWLLWTGKEQNWCLPSWSCNASWMITGPWSSVSILVSVNIPRLSAGQKAHHKCRQYSNVAFNICHGHLVRRFSYVYVYVCVVKNMFRFNDINGQQCGYSFLHLHSHNLGIFQISVWYRYSTGYQINARLVSNMFSNLLVFWDACCD